MRTYQELAALGGDEGKRMDFVRAAVTSHQASDAYKLAKDAEEYYARRNVTMTRYVKVLYNVLGQAVPDLFSADYKLTHGFFRRFVLQQVQYVLSNGVTFRKPATKQKLGRSFDNQLSLLAKKAMVDGVSFGFWNYDRLAVFSFADTRTDPGFAPLYDEVTGALRAGVRYWQTVDGKARRYTLYEEDGYTEYILAPGGEMTPMEGGKRSYKQRISSAPATGVMDVTGENYHTLPIIPMYANDQKESELVGVRSSIDCYDFIKSGMANNVDETSAFYWTLKNAGGMEDIDLQRFVERMKILKAVELPDGVEAVSHTIDVPVEANERLLDRLRSDLYEDFMLMDTQKALSGNMTATAIRLAYQQQDDKCGDFEYCIRDFISPLLELVGVEDVPEFKWNRIANQTEETQMVMTAAAYLDDEAVLNHLPWLTPEEVEEILKRRTAEEWALTEQAQAAADPGETAPADEAEG